MLIYPLGGTSFSEFCGDDCLDLQACPVCLGYEFALEDKRSFAELRNHFFRIFDLKQL